MPEIKDQETTNTKKQLVNMIATQLYKFVNSSTYDVKSLVMLVAALSLLNTSDDNQQAINTARRLTTSALSRTNKKP